MPFVHKKKPLNKDARAIRDYVNAYLATHGQAPSYTQICEHVGIESKATVARHIASSEKRGLLNLPPSRPVFFQQHTIGTLPTR